MIAARYAWSPPAARSLGEDCIAFWKAAGGTLFDWQELVIIGMLGLDEDDRFVSTEDGLDVARQNGKGVILQAIESFVAFELGRSLGYDVVMHTAHEFATSQEHQLRLDEVIQNASHLHARVKDRGGYKHANGQESINLKDGTRIVFKARTKGGGRGYSGDLLVWDEAMVVPDTVVGAQKPMLRASSAAYGAKTIYAGSAVDQQIHEYGVQFARVRKRGIAQDPRVSYHEWSAPFDDPDEMTADLLRDRSLWPLANPSMEEGLIPEDIMADEVESMPLRTVAVELLGVGDWPDVDASGSGLFDMGKWNDLQVPVGFELESPFLALDVSPLRTWATIVAAGRNGDKVRIRVVERLEGTGWVIARIAELIEELSAVATVCDERGPAANLIPDLEAAGIKVHTVNSSEYASACGDFFDAYQQDLVEHEPSAVLDAAVRGAAQRSLGDAWAWSRKQSKADITPLVGATLAHWASSRVKPQAEMAWAFG